MPRRIRSRTPAGASIQNGGTPIWRSAHSSSRTRNCKPVRVIGAPIPITLPKLHGLVPRYCSRSDDQVAAKLALSMLRLGISRADDWKGGVVDFIAKGLARFCRQNGSVTVARVFPESTIRIMDELLERGEIERCQSEDDDIDRMFVLVDYEQAAMIPIGPTLACLGKVHELLPAAFHVVFAANLALWMRTYDYRDAEFYAEEQKHMLDEEELKESFYPEVEKTRPKCLSNPPEYEEAVTFLQRVQGDIKVSAAARMIRLCLAMHDAGHIHEPAWPSKLQKQLPELQEYFECTDEPGPGSLIVFEEDDLIEACFTEEMQYLGQNYAIGSTRMLLIDLKKSVEALDRQVAAAFDHIKAMLQSLSHATELIEIIRGIYGEDLRQRGVESRVPA
jgi:hypothetical protein